MPSRPSSGSVRSGEGRPSQQFSQGEAKEALLSYLVQGQLHVVKTREEADVRPGRAVEGR